LSEILASLNQIIFPNFGFAERMEGRSKWKQELIVKWLSTHCSVTVQSLPLPLPNQDWDRLHAAFTVNSNHYVCRCEVIVEKEMSEWKVGIWVRHFRECPKHLQSGR
jgi:hypothetical protein